ncbi:hypothetical protein [Mesorhizobium sp. 128a]
MKRIILPVATAIGLLGLFVAARSFLSVVDQPAQATAPSDDDNHDATTEADDRAVKDKHDFICLNLPRWTF